MRCFTNLCSLGLFCFTVPFFTFPTPPLLMYQRWKVLQFTFVFNNTGFIVLSFRTWCDVLLGFGVIFRRSLIPSFRIWGDFSPFRLLGFRLIFRRSVIPPFPHSIIPPFWLLGVAGIFKPEVTVFHYIDQRTLSRRITYLFFPAVNWLTSGFFH